MASLAQSQQERESDDARNSLKRGDTKSTAISVKHAAQQELQEKAQGQLVVTVRWRPRKELERNFLQASVQYFSSRGSSSVNQIELGSMLMACGKFVSNAEIGRDRYVIRCDVCDRSM